MIPRWVWVFVGAAGAAAIGLLYGFDPAAHEFYPRCYWRAWTGWNCAGCGVLRSTHHLLHGEIGTAFRYNPLWVVMLPVLAGWGGWRWVRTKRAPAAPPRLADRRWHGWAVFWVVALVAYTVARNVPLPALAWLAPP